MELDNRFVIWGCGSRGRRFANTYLRSYIAAFIDQNPDLCGKIIDGIPIISYENFAMQYSDLVFWWIISPPAAMNRCVSDGRRNIAVLLWWPYSPCSSLTITAER